MRAGCFAEDRVIDLIHRRFIPFYYCTGGPGLGHDDAAKAFVGTKTRNPWAFLAIFDPKGTILGESKIYSDKNETFAFLRNALAKHPDKNKKTEAERTVLEKISGETASPSDRLAAARLLEELGEYEAAREQYERIAHRRDSRPQPGTASALLGLLRIHRYTAAWKRHAAAEQTLRALIEEAPHEHALRNVDADMERGYRLLARKEYAAARKLLQKQAWTQSKSTRTAPRLAELHFYAGVACWMSGDRDWAKFHWCWVAEKMPHDRLCRRAYIAAASEVMPYVNPELGGFKAERRGIGTGTIVHGYNGARKGAASLRKRFEAGFFTGSDKDKPEKQVDIPPRKQR